MIFLYPLCIRGPR